MTMADLLYVLTGIKQGIQLMSLAILTIPVTLLGLHFIQGKGKGGR